MGIKNKSRIAGILIIVGFIVGLLSVVPVVDSKEYLIKAAESSNEVIIASIFQFILSIAYIGFAVLLYPLLRNIDKSLALGFLSFRITASTLLIVGTIILLSILAVNHEYVNNHSTISLELEAIGNLLKITRDLTNHVFMVLVLGTGNILFYILLLKSSLIPRWISVWGILAASLSSLASILVLFQTIEIITSEYIILNVPTALQELVLASWFIVKGLAINTQKEN